MGNRVCRVAGVGERNEGSQMLNAPEPRVACAEVILDWGQLSQLADFAELRHGYANSNGGFGIIYPEDLDEYSVEVEGIHIRPGSLLVYGLAHAVPPGWEILVDERFYLHVLSSVLREHGLAAEATRVERLPTARGSGDS